MASSFDDVHLSFTRSGGQWGKALPPVELDESELSPEEAVAWAEVARSEVLERGAPKGEALGTSADEYQYDLVVRRGGDQRTIRVTEFTAPPELAELIRLLEQRVEQAEREATSRSDPRREP